MVMVESAVMVLLTYVSKNNVGTEHYVPKIVKFVYKTNTAR